LQRNRLNIVPIGALLLILLAGCGPSRLTLEGYRLKKNIIETDNRKVESGDLYGYLQQNPNKRFAGLNLYTWIYKQSFKGKERGYKSWFREKFGQEPVMVDNGRMDASARDMKLFLNNLGYFESVIATDITYSKKKAKAYYFVSCRDPYSIRHISKSIRDDTIAAIVEQLEENSLIKSGDNFNSYTLNDERTRITDYLKNNGYYFFTKDFIRFEVDSNLKNHQMDLIMVIDNNRRISPDNPDSIIEYDHQKYKIRNVYIEPHFNPMHADTGSYDTLDYVLKRKDADECYTFIYRDELKIKPQVITQSVYLIPGEIFRSKDVTQTNMQLTLMPYNRLVNISFNEPEDSVIDPEEDIQFLDAQIQIANSPVNSFGIETDVTNSAGDPGLAGSIVIQNKNLFRGAEVFRIRLRGAVDLQRSAQEAEKKLWFFNTAEAGVETSIYFPRFLVPISQEKFPKYFRPRTSISLSYTFQLQPDYTRHLPRVSFGYNWDPSRRRHNDLYPIELTSVRIFPDDSSDFYKYVNETNDPWLKEQYTDHFIVSSRYNYIFTTQQLNKPVDFIYFNYQLETGGNLVNMVKKLMDAPQSEEGKYQLFGMPYSQYFRGEADFRHYHYLASERTLVLRGLLGLGIPYGNSTSLPFERAFPAGGANDMRGWIYRRLGPGSYATDSIDFDRAGDIKLLGNIEYRFGLYKILKAALFTDIGNVWLMNKSEQFPGGEFRFDRFYEEFAIDAGIGARLDFSFFIIRLDMAAQIRDPFMPDGQRWIFSPEMKSNVVWNFGIGYPF
jgi:outer membrane protein assembly factor BamA